MQTYPLGIAIARSGGRKAKADRHIRSARQRRKAYEKHQMTLIMAAWKKWGDTDDMPKGEQNKLHKRLAQLRVDYGVISLSEI